VERAVFDPSPQAVLARKYAAAAERGFYKALKELRLVEAEAAARRESEPSQDEVGDYDLSGSFRTAPAPEPAPAEPAPAPAAPAAEPEPDRVAAAPVEGALPPVKIRILPNFTRAAGSEGTAERSEWLPGVSVPASPLRAS
jgi:hypothetical protein